MKIVNVVRRIEQAAPPGDKLRRIEDVVEQHANTMNDSIGDWIKTIVYGEIHPLSKLAPKDLYKLEELIVNFHNVLAGAEKDFGAKVRQLRTKVIE